MSDLNNGKQCLECAETGRCLATCVTKGWGDWLGRADNAIGVTPCFMPNGERGVRVTSASSAAGGRAIHHTGLGNATAEVLLGLIRAAMDKP